LERTDDSPTVISLDDGRQLAYTEYGSSEGVPVVFLHGTPGSRRLAALFDSAAREHDVRLLALDRPGYGRSSPRPTRTIGDASQFVGAVLDHADVETASLIAFSGGAPYALATAAATQDTVDRVDVVSGATPPTISEERPAIQGLLTTLATTTPALLGGLFRGQAWLARRRDPSVVVSQYTADENTESVPDDVAETVKDDFLEAFSRHRRGAVTEFRNPATEWNVDFDDIDVAVHLWHGENDTNVPIGDVRRLEAQIPTAELQVLEDADHLRTLLRSVPTLLAARR